MGQGLSLLRRRCHSGKKASRRRQQCRDEFRDSKRDLTTILRPIYTSLFQEINYHGYPKVKEGAPELLLAAMLKRAAKIGLPIEGDSLSMKGFRLGFSEGLLAYPGHPVEVQAYIGIWTWLVVLLDDRTGLMKDDVEKFQQRFSAGEKQPTPLLQGLADIFLEAYEHWDPILANIMVTSGLNFVTSNLLEIRPEFRSMEVTPAGTSFPYYYRDLAGITEAYAIFTYPKALYPEMGCFIEAIPDIAIFINIFNDVVSFYKEEVAGETRNYVHNRAMVEQKDVLQVVSDVKVEVVDCVNRIRSILKGRGKYLEAWELHMAGHIGMHTTNPRYKLVDLNLGEPHPFPKTTTLTN